MTFKIKPVTSIKEKIKIQVPKDLGRCEVSEIKVEFKKLPVSETKQLLEDASRNEMNDDQVLQENIIGIDGLLDESGVKVEYSADVLLELLEMEYVRRPIIKKFMEVVVGREALKPKKLIELGKYLASSNSSETTEQDLQDDRDIIQISGDADAFWKKQVQPDEFELWDENFPAYNLFQQCQTQWNVSMSGVTGLNYPALQAVMTMTAVPTEKQTTLFEEIRFIESGFLAAISEQRKNNG